MDLASERAGSAITPSLYSFIDPVANSAAFLRDKKANISTALNVNVDDVDDQVGERAACLRSEKLLFSVACAAARSLDPGGGRESQPASKSVRQSVKSVFRLFAAVDVVQILRVPKQPSFLR